MTSNNSSREISPDVEVEKVFSKVKSECESDEKDRATLSRSRSGDNDDDDAKEESNPKIFEFWHDGSRRSAFSPYTRPNTTLTNLQRGNVKTETTVVIPDFSIHQLAAQGQLIASMKIADIDEKDSNGLTPLIWACSYGQFPTVIMLLEKGADVHVVGNNGENSLLLASSNGHTDIVKLLIKKKMDINHTDVQGNTALMYTAYDNHAACTEELLKNGADFTLNNLNGETCYSIAVAKGSKHVQSVLEKHMLALLESHF